MVVRCALWRGDRLREIFITLFLFAQHKQATTSSDCDVHVLRRCEFRTGFPPPLLLDVAQYYSLSFSNMLHYVYDIYFLHMRLFVDALMSANTYRHTQVNRHIRAPIAPIQSATQRVHSFMSVFILHTCAEIIPLPSCCHRCKCSYCAKTRKTLMPNEK